MAYAVAYFVVDVLAVFLFIVVGRDALAVPFSGDLALAWPYFAGTVLGWIVGRVWKAPRAVRWTGVIVWVATVAIGLLLRFAIGQPIDSRYAVITFIALGMFLLGWRALAWVLVALFGREKEKVVDEKYRR